MISFKYNESKIKINFSYKNKNYLKFFILPNNTHLNHLII